ncbi:MAG: hypothetical protein ACYS22_04800 [Planctomycetota bacterium]
MTPPFEEIAAFALVLVWLASRWRSSPEPGWFARYAAMAIAGWVAETTCIHLYGFYAYSPGWHLMVGVVPLAVVCVWPVVIESAGALAAEFTQNPLATMLATAALVFTDAALIEPVAVHSGLWHWTAPGLFEVPPVGVLGWAIFAGAAWRWLGSTRGITRWAVVVVAPVATHAGLLLAWWGGLRWVSGTIAPAIAVPVAAGISLGLAALAARTGRVPALPVLMARLPGALFFFVLLALRGREAPWLIAWVLSFAAPYLVLTVRALRCRE